MPFLFLSQKGRKRAAGTPLLSPSPPKTTKTHVSTKKKKVGKRDLSVLFFFRFKEVLPIVFFTFPPFGLDAPFFRPAVGSRQQALSFLSFSHDGKLGQKKASGFLCKLRAAKGGTPSFFLFFHFNEEEVPSEGSSSGLFLFPPPPFRVTLAVFSPFLFGGLEKLVAAPFSFLSLPMRKEMKHKPDSGIPLNPYFEYRRLLDLFSPQQPSMENGQI